MSRWSRLAGFGPAFALAALGAVDSVTPAGQCPRLASAEVVVKALRFSDGLSYAFTVTNNGSSPIRGVTIGWGGPPYIEYSPKTEPVSMGSPSGWQSRAGRAQDPRLPGSHSHTLITYQWSAEKDAHIHPGRTLAGFSVQLPTPLEMEMAYLRHLESWDPSAGPSDLPKDPPINDRLPPQPDLARVSFEVDQHVGRCSYAVGTVVPDRTGDGGGEGSLH